jgi:hypothetical protein
MGYDSDDYEDKRANEIVDWAIETGRSPDDTAGMDTDDEVWLLENDRWLDEILYRINERKEEIEKERLEKLEKLEKANRRLAVAKSLNIRLGGDTPLNPDLMDKITAELIGAQTKKSKKKKTKKRKSKKRKSKKKKSKRH